LHREISSVRAFAAWTKKLSTRLAISAAAFCAALLLWHSAREAQPATALEAAPVMDGANRAPPPDAAAATPAEATGAPAQPATSGAIAQQAAVGTTIEVTVGRNDTLDAIFRRLALDKADLAAIRNLPGIRQSIDFLKPGDAIQVTQAASAVEELTRKVSETQTLKVVRTDHGFAAQMIDNPIETRTRAATGVIDSSLFLAAEAVNVSDAVALKLANIFAWDIDFVLDIRAGDHFTVVYEQIYQDGRYLRDGEILAADFVNSGKVYRAVGFKGPSGQLAYYTPNGQPMRKAFLRAPVEFTRVSSVFNPHRFHPILQTIRGHMGTDYAAPIGTPVHASGDGRVSFIGTRGGYGNAIVLAHSNSISTLYGHMSRFAKSLHVGTHVQQGEVIGYVGMTGLATGPHLHYEYLVDGVHKNPETVRLPGAEPLQAQALRDFLAASAPMLSRLEPAPGPAAAANRANVPPAARNPAATPIAAD
jgi:murein DD-endopeptidase MepM/ murein hydrolase activator NlpD